MLKLKIGLMMIQFSVALHEKLSALFEEKSLKILSAENLRLLPSLGLLFLSYSLLEFPISHTITWEKITNSLLDTAMKQRNN